jgi:hypothetical protein
MAPVESDIEMIHNRMMELTKKLNKTKEAINVVSNRNGWLN